MDNSKLNSKDLINVGIFTALYFVVFFLVGMLGFVPILLIMLPIIAPIITGIPFMLFITKVHKFGMITIMGTILGLVMFLTGHSWPPIIFGSICALLADLIMKSGNYQSFKHTAIGYGVFSIWIVSNMMPAWIMRESYFQTLASQYGEEYASSVMNLSSNWMLFILLAAAFVCGIIGAYFGRRVLNKHFVRAGIV